LKTDKQVYLEYQKAQSEFEKLSRLVVAHEWTILRARSQKTAEAISAKQAAIKDGQRTAKRLGEEMKKIEKEVEEITAKRDKEMAKGGKIQTLQDNLKELAKELAKIKTQSELKKQTIADDEKRVAELEVAAKEVRIVFVCLQARQPANILHACSWKRKRQRRKLPRLP
jgi:structural maintenance of chromosome 2